MDDRNSVCVCFGTLEGCACCEKETTPLRNLPRMQTGSRINIEGVVARVQSNGDFIITDNEQSVRISAGHRREQVRNAHTGDSAEPVAGEPVRLEDVVLELVYGMTGWQRMLVLGSASSGTLGNVESLDLQVMVNHFVPNAAYADAGRIEFGRMSLREHSESESSGEGGMTGNKGAELGMGTLRDASYQGDGLLVRDLHEM